MFDFLVEIIRDDGTRHIERFDTASDFLEACEREGGPTPSFSFTDEVAKVQYIGASASPPNSIWTVWDLYCWMCGDECDWFD